MSTQTAPNPVQGDDLAQAHIAANTAIQEAAAAAAAAAWLQLGSYDEVDVPRFLARVVPVILAAQRRTVALTTAYLSRAIGRRVAPVDVEQLIGAAIRTATPEVIEASQRGGLALAPDATGVPPEITYRRPFTALWRDLAEHKDWDAAVSAGLGRIEATAALDVQNSMRHTLRAVGGSEDLILGYRRVPNVDACPLCLLAAGRRYLRSDLLPIHARCRCTVDVIVAANRDQFFGKRDNDLAVGQDGLTAITRIHGELGPLIVPGGDHFTTQDDLAA